MKSKIEKIIKAASHFNFAAKASIAKASAYTLAAFGYYSFAYAAAAAE